MLFTPRSMNQKYFPCLDHRATEKEKKRKNKIWRKESTKRQLKFIYVWQDLSHLSRNSLDLIVAHV